MSVCECKCVAFSNLTRNRKSHHNTIGGKIEKKLSGQTFFLQYFLSKQSDDKLLLQDATQFDWEIRGTTLHFAVA